MKLRALDLFCCAGGASMGMHRAGFEVVGVDIRPQPHYPFEFHQADALTYPLEGFDFVWASPPCQGYTVLRHAPGTKGAPRLIAEIRENLEDAVEDGRIGAFAIENVIGARDEMFAPILLCGSMFGLGAQGCRLDRHRLIETSFVLDAPPHAHEKKPAIGIYGGHARKRSASAGGRGTRDIWEGGHKAAAQEAMGIDWMTLGEMSEAIPPAYSEFIGRAAIAQEPRT